MKALRRSGLPPDALCSIVDPLETQNFRVIAQLAEGGCAGVALETERPERLLESEGVGYAVCRHPQRVGGCLQMLQFLWCEFLLRAHTAPPFGSSIITQVRRFCPYGSNACPPNGAMGQNLVSIFLGTV